MSNKRSGKPPKDKPKKKKKRRKKQPRGPQKLRGVFQPALTKRISPQKTETTINRLPAMSFDQIRRVWSNAIRYIGDAKNPAMQTAAKKMLVAIEHEWSRRAKLGIEPDDYFDWPSTDAPGGTGRLILSNVQPDGMLSYLSYRVGQTHGVATNIRRIILHQVFERHLPPVFPPIYLVDWYLPNSSGRLKKLADTIASLARNAKRRKDVDMSDAVHSWEQDLEYLYNKYYVGRFGFGWPTTESQ